MTQFCDPCDGGDAFRSTSLPFNSTLRGTSTMKEEMILVVRRTLLEKLGVFHGLNFDVERYLPALLARENNFFMPRSEAETNPAFKQIIPYVLITHEGRVLHYVRGKKAGEQ